MMTMTMTMKTFLPIRSIYYNMEPKNKKILSAYVKKIC